MTRGVFARVGQGKGEAMNRRWGTVLLAIGLAGGMSPAARAEVATFGGMGTPHFAADVPCLTDEERATIRAQIEASRAALAARGELRSARHLDAAPAAVAFGWLLRLLPVLDDPGCHGVSNY